MCTTLASTAIVEYSSISLIVASSTTESTGLLVKMSIFLSAFFNAVTEFSFTCHFFVTAELGSVIK